MTGVRLLPVGDTGWLLEVDPVTGGDEAATAARVLALARRVRAGTGGLVRDVVPAARTVLVTCAVADHDALAARLRGVLAAREGPGHPGGEVRGEARGESVEDGPAAGALVLTVALDGPDLDSTAGDCGLSGDGLRERLLSTTWTVAFAGFAPGFGYLVGGGLDVPRLARPRQRVPAGSVALAGPYAGVYPRESPGGWRLVGRLVADPGLFDPDRTPQALLGPGRSIRFAVP